jgi:hypothetical protein
MYWDSFLKQVASTSIHMLSNSALTAVLLVDAAQAIQLINA